MASIESVDATLTPCRPPQQERSRRALQRLLVAAEEVLATKGLDDFTMNAVAEKACVSVGAIYRRFEGKEQLLAAVSDRLLDRMEKNLSVALEAAEPTLAGTIRALVQASVEDLTTNTTFPVLYGPAMALTARVHAAIEARRRLFFEAVEPHLGEVQRNEQQMTVVMVQAVITGACVHRASEGANVGDGLTWDQFAEQLEEVALSYVRAGGPQNLGR